MDKHRLDRLGKRLVEQQRVWKYVPAPAGDGAVHVAPESAARPRTLTNRVVATEVVLADGSTLWALLENVDVTSPQFTRHWMVSHFLVGARWWRLARYHDIDADKRSPQALAAKLGKAVDEVFPISYDIRAHCAADSEALTGRITAEPDVRLKRAEIIAMAVPQSR